MTIRWRNTGFEELYQLVFVVFSTGLCLNSHWAFAQIASPTYISAEEYFDRFHQQQEERYKELYPPTYGVRDPYIDISPNSYLPGFQLSAPHLVKNPARLNEYFDDLAEGNSISSIDFVSNVVDPDGWDVVEAAKLRAASLAVATRRTLVKHDDLAITIDDFKPADHISPADIARAKNANSVEKLYALAEKRLQKTLMLFQQQS